MRKRCILRPIASMLAAVMTFYAVVPVKAAAANQVEKTLMSSGEWSTETELATDSMLPSVEPEVPIEPEIPVEPEVPVEPEIPVEPETPVEPEAPVEPEIPVEPEAPVEPNVPGQPGETIDMVELEPAFPIDGSAQDELTQTVYREGKIILSNYEQLMRLGTNEPVTILDQDSAAVGTGEQVLDEAGNIVTYSLDANYVLANEIALPHGTVWTLPEGFTGRIAPDMLMQPEETRPLYDTYTDTIYLYHPYQLATIAMENAAEQPVLDQDADASHFGVGQLIFPQGEEQNFLTYDSNHNYVLSADFCSDRPEIMNAELYASPSGDGRDFAGQLIKNINGKDYILIGNANQLRAIGTNNPVMGAVYQAYKPAFGNWTVDKGKDGNPIMLYGGDADLLQSQNGTKDYPFGKPDATDKNLSDQGGTKGRCGVDPKTGEINPKLDIETLGKSYTYSNSANYIVFRDIDLNHEKWEPLEFCGDMIGAKSTNGEKVWDEAGTAIIAAERPVISNVLVSQDTQRKSDQTMGVGFFSTIHSKPQLLGNALSSPDQAVVKNLILDGVSVTNNQTKVNNDPSILGALVGGLGSLIGGLLDIVLGILGIHTDLNKILGALLNARTVEPSFYATGGFAGRIVGNALVSGCEVRNVQVSNVTSFTGGFVGYTDGAARYLLDAVGQVLNLLTKILNAVPWLGLGDLVNVVLQLLSVDKLIVTGYDNPVITDCTVTGLSGTVGNVTNAPVAKRPTMESGRFAGGFVGAQIGTEMTGCMVKDSTYTVQADKYGGGFAGIIRDGEISGILKDIGLELLKVIQPQSLAQECAIQNSNVTVNGGSYLGGFTGALASSYAVNDTVTGTLNVSGTGSNVGGFSGIATLGWTTNLGADEVKKENLLSTVKELLLSLLGNPSSGALLSLVGLSPSAILGVQMNCTDIKVSADGDYVGGILGRGDGAYLADTSKYAELPAWKHGKAPVPADTARTCAISGLSSVHAGGNYAGGVVGSMVTASAAGVLDGTLGLAHMLGFTTTDIQLSGNHFSVIADGSYAGGCAGEAVGGKIQNVHISGIETVTAQDRAGGFIGVAGPGDLAGSGGLELKLLGLKLLEIKNLLAVGQGIMVSATDCSVDGSDTGLTVTANGTGAADHVTPITAAGFTAKSNSTELMNCHVSNLLSVSAPDLGGYAGGFVGTSETGGLADVVDKGQLGDLIKLGNLVNAVGYLIPKYTNCTVTFLENGGVQGDVAGGFAADFRSGKVDNTARGEQDGYAVYNIDHVNGQSYAGGFGGRVTSGALASAGGGLSILGGLTGVSINISDLLSVVEAYVPYITYAGVKSDNGFVVSAPITQDANANSGSAGGFIGYTSGAQISHCDVNRLRHTKVTPPENLEAVQAPSYFDTSSQYAVHGARYAGGYVGHLDIGSAASLGSGLKILGNTIQLTNILDALSVVVSTVEHSNVVGSAGGFSVRGDHSGGFAGQISGGHVQNSHVDNFAYIIGLSTAGGYVGNLLPGNVAEVLDNTSILGGLVSGDAALASLAENFVPSIRNSTTSGIPCGGAIRANDPSTPQLQKGSAGGYVGLNEGGQIRGNDTSRWKSEKTYTGPTSECKVERLDSVYGYEYAGGFTGLMRSADTANVGGLKLLGGIIEVGNILGALSITYPTQTDTATYGPLANLDYETWNAWVKYVGKYGGRGEELAAHGPVKDQAELDAILKDFVYGYTVAAGRTEHDAAAITEGGNAGGYVGTMISGVVTNGQAHDVKAVTAMRNAGGYAGKMRSGGAAEFGTVKILGLKLNLGQLVQAAQFFVPVVKGSSVEGYRSGLTVTATGKDIARSSGNAGGYVGSAYGAQIWGDKPNAVSGCHALNLRRISGGNTAGGYAGYVTAGSLAKVNTNAADDFLQSVLDHIIGNLGNLLSIMDATVTTIRGVKVTAADPEWGFVVTGDAEYAGGFAGSLEAAVIGSSKNESQITVENLRSVEGGLYAGGFFGLADVTGVAQVGSNDGKTNILELIKLGKVDVLDAFRTYIYHASVNGVDEGIQVRATRSNTTGMLDSKRHMGSAGGFGGGMMNGSIHDCSVTNVSTVQGLNYVGGFVGHLGKNGVVKADDANVSDLIGLNAGVLNIFGAHTENCSVAGVPTGFEVRAQAGEQPMVGGFSGYADLSRVKNSTVTNLKKVVSPQIAGGFVGKTDMSYLVETQVDSALVDLVLKIVNELVKFLYLDKVQDVNLIKIQLPPPLNKLLELQIMGDGNLVYVNLLGLKISVSLSKAEPGKPDQTDTVIVTIGDSKISLPCSKDGIDTSGEHGEIEIALIKGNRTKIADSSVSGISLGYDVYGGGAGDTEDGTHTDGYAGGFVGLNHEGVISGSQMYWCDVVRGTSEKVGPFTGTTQLDSVYDFNTIKSIEGDGNGYRVYRPQEDALLIAQTKNDRLIANAVTDDTYQMVFNRFDVTHLAVIEKFKDFEDAVMTDGAKSLPLGVYESSAKAVLMRDTNLSDNHNGITPEPGESPDPCEQGMDLTITKVWKDWYNPSHRPESIQVEIWQSYTDAQGTKHDALYQTVTISIADAQKETETWKKVVSDLPVAKKETVDGQEVIYYYQYSVKEVPVPGYSSEISTDKTGQIIITNTAPRPELPHTGGIGDWCFIFIGGMFVLLGLHKKKKQHQATAE